MISRSWLSQHDEATGSSPRRHPARRAPGLRRWVGRHRRSLAALLLAIAAGTGIEAVTSPPPVGVEVAVAASDLPAGHRLTERDLRRARLPADAVPAGVLPTAQLVGERLAGPVRAGEPLTDRRMESDGPAAGLATGRVAMPVDLRAGVTPWLRPGTKVSLLASRGEAVDSGVNHDDVLARAPARLVARDVVVLDVPAPDDEGLLSTADVAGTRTVLLAVRPDEAAALASVSGGWWLSPVLLP